MRLPRPRIENCCVHVTHRCQQRLFLLGTDVDRRQYVKRLWEASRRFPAVRVVDYGVTANHIHLLAWVPRMADHSRLSLGHGASPEPRRGDASPRTPRCTLAVRSADAGRRRHRTDRERGGLIRRLGAGIFSDGVSGISRTTNCASTLLEHATMKYLILAFLATCLGLLAESAGLRAVREIWVPEGWTPPEVVDSGNGRSYKPSVPSGFTKRDIGATLWVKEVTIHKNLASKGPKKKYTLLIGDKEVPVAPGGSVRLSGKRYRVVGEKGDTLLLQDRQTKVLIKFVKYYVGRPQKVAPPKPSSSSGSSSSR
jgi:hypothetical protein